ncbi:MAG: fibronectin type III domain-containing protein [Steroidobacteraceae bacterium]
MSLARQRTRVAAWLAVLVVATLAAPAHAAPQSRVYAARTSSGAVRVLAVVADGSWPAGGLRIEDASGAALVAHVAADPAAAAKLDAASQNALRAFQHLPLASDSQGKTANTLLVLRVLSDFDFARAAGVAAELPQGMHATSVRVVLLNSDGSAAATLTPVTVADDAGPPAATGLNATAEPRGVILKWQTAAHASTVPAYAYSVERTSGGAREPLTLHPQLLTVDKGTPNPFIDHAPPVEVEVSYELRIVDVLGVPSAPAAVQVTSPDFAAGAPPAGQSAKAVRGSVTLGWTALANSRASGLVVERSQLADGPYEWLTPKGLSPQSTHFEDHDVLPGGNYYYRVRAVTPGGALGAPGDPVHAQVLAPAGLAAPQGLKADVGTNQVVLSWKAVPGTDLAGYIVERRAVASAPRWARLNTRLLPETRYLDIIGGTSGGTFEYRVTAVATDEGQSAPSEALRVALSNAEAPPTPILVSASGAEGHVVIHFAAAEPAAKTAQVALVRADSPAAAGLVIGAPVSAAWGAITDDWVRAGQRYWYRLVAFDGAGNRSSESDSYSVRVSAVTLPTPRAPSVVYAAQPVPQTTLTFEAPPPHVRAIVQVQLEDGRWRAVTGPTIENHAVDLAPPGAHASYRIVYVGETGGGARPSEAAAAH